MKLYALIMMLAALTLSAEMPSPLAFPAVTNPDDCGACSTNPAVINPVTTTRVSFDVTLRIPSGGLTKYVVIYNWPAWTEAARVRVPEPTGLRASWYRRTNGTQVWWDVQAFTNFTQVIHVDFTNVGAVGLFAVITSNN